MKMRSMCVRPVRTLWRVGAASLQAKKRSVLQSGTASILLEKPGQGKLRPWR
jgi:hypothetical protein